MCEKVEVGKVYRDMAGDNMLVLRDVPQGELRFFHDPAFEYVEVVYADRLDMTNGWRRKHDGKYPLYAAWANHPSHLVLK